MACEACYDPSEADSGCLLHVGVIAGALLALWDLAAERCSDAGSWCARAFSGTRTSSSANSFPDGSGHQYYQAAPDEMPAEYWVRIILPLRSGAAGLLASNAAAVYIAAQG